LELCNNKTDEWKFELIRSKLTLFDFFDGLSLVANDDSIQKIKINELKIPFNISN